MGSVIGRPQWGPARRGPATGLEQGERVQGGRLLQAEAGVWVHAWLQGAQAERS